MVKKYDINKVNGLNAFAVMSYVTHAMEDCKMSHSEISDYKKDATSDTYDYLVEVSEFYLNHCNRIAEGRL